MVKTDQWKYVMNAHDLDELYNLKKDPWEMKNLINEARFSAILTEMKARMLGGMMPPAICLSGLGCVIISLLLSCLEMPVAKIYL